MNEWKVIWFVGIVGSFVGGVIGVKVGVMIGVFGGLIGLVVVGVIGGVFGMFVGDKVLSVVVSKFLGWKVDEMFVNVEVVVKVVKVVESLVVDVWFGLCIDQENMFVLVFNVKIEVSDIEMVNKFFVQVSLQLMWMMEEQ